MGEKNLLTKLGLITVIVGLGVWQAYPPKQKIKPGIDLGGGHSLLFEIDDTGVPDIQKPTLATDVMAILKQRVDPGNTRNLVWRPIGWNRLEIQMPRPSEEMKKPREAFEKARNDVTNTNISEAQVRSALSLPPDQRQTAFNELVKGMPVRQALFAQLAKAEDELARLQAAVASQPAGTTQPATQAVSPELAAKSDEAFIARRKAIEDLLKTNLDVRVLMDVLALSAKSPVRAERLAAIEKDYPDLKDRIAAVIATFDDWARTRGALDDPSDLMRLLRGAGKLEFRILATVDPANPQRLAANNPLYREDAKKYQDQLAKYGPRPREGDNYQWFRIAKPDENDISKGGYYIVSEYLGTKYVLAHATDDMGLLNKGDKAWQLRGAFESMDRTGRPAVSFELDAKGGKIFGDLTRNNIEKPLCIFLDNDAMSAATIRSEITTSGQISGNFSSQDVAAIINVLNAGVLPARLKETPLQVKSVGPSLGATNIHNGLMATMLAVLVTILFMAVYYNYNGVIADIAVLLNILITLGVMSFIQATFTLPGIAGLVLTLGMAVDANVLIFERMREELQRGVTVRMAIKLGYERAFSAILDSNVTTILTAIILVAIGSEEIKGFGLTLGIGLTISMFTALFVTRQYYNIMVPSTLDATEMRKISLGTICLALLAGTFLGVGYVMSPTARIREESALWGLGVFFAVMFGAAAFLLVTMFLFRFMYRVLGHQKAGKLPMLKLISTPTINWMGIYKKFWIGSAVVIGLGFIFVFEVNKDDVLDIEFLGGTSVQVQINPSREQEFQVRGDEKLLEYIRSDMGADGSSAGAAGWLRWSADQIRKANVTAYEQGGYLVSGFDAALKPSQAEVLLKATLGEYLVRGGVMQARDGINLHFSPDSTKDIVTDAASAQKLVREAAGYLDSAADRMRGTRVQMVEEKTAGGQIRRAFDVVTTESQSELVAESLRAALGDLLEVTQPINARLVRDEKLAPDGFFPIEFSDSRLGDAIGNGSMEPIDEFKGGVAMVFENAEPPATEGQVAQRIRDMRLQSDFEDIGARDLVKVIALETKPATEPDGQPLVTKFAYVVSDPNLPYVEGEDNARWRVQVAERELKLVQDALSKSPAFQRVTQFSPQVAGEAVQAAVIAVMLSMLAIAVYLWIRFGSVDFGLAGIIALYHDVAVTVAVYLGCHYIHDTAFARALLIEDFKVDLNFIAALLTIVGFSINDTIVIFDRIRENRGRMATFSPRLINDSLNQCFSRTIITTLTVLTTVIVLYVFGGEGIHGFAFAMIIGAVTGVYSTLAVAAPMVQHPRVMWVVTIVLAALTAALIVHFLGLSVTAKAIMMVGIVVAAVFALVRQWRATEGGGLVQEAPAA